MSNKKKYSCCLYSYHFVPLHFLHYLHGGSPQPRKIVTWANASYLSGQYGAVCITEAQMAPVLPEEVSSSIQGKSLILTQQNAPALMYVFDHQNGRGGRGKLFIGASCATINSSHMNVYLAKVLPSTEKLEAEISNCHVNSPVKSTQIFLEPNMLFSGEKVRFIMLFCMCFS